MQVTLRESVQGSCTDRHGPLLLFIVSCLLLLVAWEWQVFWKSCNVWYFQCRHEGTLDARALLVMRDEDISPVEVRYKRTGAAAAWIRGSLITRPITALRAAMMGVQTAAENWRLQTWKVKNRMGCASASARFLRVTKSYDHVTCHAPSRPRKHCLVTRSLGRNLFRSGFLAREVWNITLGLLETATFLVRFTAIDRESLRGARHKI